MDSEINKLELYQRSQELVEQIELCLESVRVIQETDRQLSSIVEDSKALTSGPFSNQTAQCEQLIKEHEEVMAKLHSLQ